MTELEHQLLGVLKERSFSNAGPFRLASGAISNYYIDGRMTAISSVGTYLTGQVVYERTKDLAIDAIGGLEVGAVPMTAASVLTYHLHGRTMEGFWVRAKSKDHGTKKMIEGKLAPGARVVIVDDVFTRGNSALQAVNEVRAIGCRVVMVLALVDRLEGAERLLRDAGVERYEAIFTIRDFGVEPNDAEKVQVVAV